MKNDFAGRLCSRIEALNNPSLLGLDPMLDYAPPALLEKARSEAKNPEDLARRVIFDFNKGILEALADIVPAVKFQIAYYEQYGPEGIRCLQDSLALAKDLGYLTILDAKRNDIGSTASAYARCILGETDFDGTRLRVYDADAVTLNAYLGIDGIEAFLEYCRAEGKGCFILVRTSNPSAGDLQDLELKDGRTVCEAMADLVAKWGDTVEGGDFSSVGAVVGATWPEQAKKLRERMPRQVFLIPGYGAQGGSALEAVAGFSQDGRGGIVNASRSLMLAWKKEEKGAACYAEASRREAERMQKALAEALCRR